MKDHICLESLENFVRSVKLLIRWMLGHFKGDKQSHELGISIYLHENISLSSFHIMFGFVIHKQVIN